MLSECYFKKSRFFGLTPLVRALKADARFVGAGFRTVLNEDRDRRVRVNDTCQSQTKRDLILYRKKSGTSEIIYRVQYR